MQSHNYLLLAHIPLYFTAHISAPQRLIMNEFKLVSNSYSLNYVEAYRICVQRRLARFFLKAYIYVQ